MQLTIQRRSRLGKHAGMIKTWTPYRYQRANGFRVFPPSCNRIPDSILCATLAEVRTYTDRGWGLRMACQETGERNNVFGIVPADWRP